MTLPFNPVDNYSFLDAFSERTTADLTKKVWSGNAGAGITSYGDLFGGKNIGARFPGTKAVVMNGYLQKSFGGSTVLGASGITSSASFGVAFKAFNLTSCYIVRFQSLLDLDSGFAIRNDGRVCLYLGPSIFNTSTGIVSLKAIHPNTFYYFEGHIGYQESDDGGVTHKLVDIRLKMDGEVIINESSYDTGLFPSGLTTYINPSKVAFDGLSFTTITDFYFYASGGAMLTDIVHPDVEGAPRVMPLKPNGAGLYSEWPLLTPASPTTHYTKVDEAIRDSSDYVETTSAPVKDSYFHEDIPTVLTDSGRDVLAAQFLFYQEGFAGTDPDTDETSVVHHLVNDIESTVIGASDVYTPCMVLDAPGTGGPFTIGDLNGVDAGMVCKLES